jgi:membrane protease YdiL (CAAX protease family)
MLRPSFDYLSHPGKMMLLLFLILAGILFSSLIGFLVAVLVWGSEAMNLITQADLANPLYLPVAKFTQIISHLGTFAISSFLFALLVSKDASLYLGLKSRPKMLSLLITLVLTFVVSPWVGYVYDLNQAMQLPSFMAGVQAWMKNSEDLAMQLTEAFLGKPTVAGFAVNLIMIGLIPAIGEEFLFRGVIQRLLKDWIGNAHVAIFISALLFSAMHMQFYGFFPRFALGLLFGYLFYWSGSLWLPMLAHFLNNGMAVLVSYLFEQGLTTVTAEDFGKTESMYWVWLSVLGTVFLSVFLYKIERSKTERLSD